jgi:hypothetical protein
MTGKHSACAFAITLLLGAGVASAQSAAAAYEPAAETTINGVILYIVPLAAADGAVGVHFDLKTAAGIVDVHIAPAMFIGMNNLSFLAEDQVEITGVAVVQDGNKAFIARTVKRGGKLLTVRADNGEPAWSPAAEGVDGCGVAHPPIARSADTRR